MIVVVTHCVGRGLSKRAAMLAEILRFRRRNVPVAILYQKAGPRDQWYHVVGTYDGDTMRLYVDGLLADSRLANYVPDDARPFELFGSGYKVAENTTFDEVAYYD